MSAPHRHAFDDPDHIVTHVERLREKVLEQIDAAMRVMERLEDQIQILDDSIRAAMSDPDAADSIEMEQANERAVAAADLMDAGTTPLERRMADALDQLANHGHFVTDAAKAALRDARRLAHQAKEARL